MRKKILAFVAAAAITGSVGANVHAKEVVVKKGDTLWGYSQTYNVSVNDIKEWNGLASDLIYPNDRLTVSPDKKYIVVKGDTLWGISRQYDVTVDELKSWNKLTSDLIFPNQELIIFTNGKPKALKFDQPVKQQKASPAVSNGKQEMQTQAGSVNKSAEPKKAEQKTNPIVTEQREEAAKPAVTEQREEVAKPAVTEQREEAAKPAVTEQREEAAKPAASETPAEPANAQSGKELIMEATAYTANCEGCSGITATGINLKDNPNQKVVSVDPSVIPLGTKVYVEGYGEAIAGDTGGAIKGNKIDIFIPTKEEALEWGRKSVKVKILN